MRVDVLGGGGGGGGGGGHFWGWEGWLEGVAIGWRMGWVWMEDLVGKSEYTHRMPKLLRFSVEETISEERQNSSVSNLALKSTSSLGTTRS